MGTLYRYQRDGKEFGPVSSGQLKRLAAAGQLGGEDLVWKEGASHRLPAGKVKGLFEPAAMSPSETTSEMPVPVAVAAPSRATDEGLGATGEGAAKGPSIWARAVGEFCATACATGGQAKRLFVAGDHKRREQQLRADARRAQCELGERLYKEGVGEAEVLAALGKVNEKILALAGEKSSTRAAAEERADLQMRLAEPWVEMEAREGMEKEHGRAVETRKALNEHMEKGKGISQGLWPAERVERRRVAVGFAAMIALVIGMGYLMMRPGAGPEGRGENQLAQSEQGEQGGQEVAMGGEGAGESAEGNAEEPGTTEEAAVGSGKSAVDELLDASIRQGSAGESGGNGIGTFRGAMARFSGEMAQEQPQQQAQQVGGSFQVTCRACGFTQTAGSYELARSLGNTHTQNANRMSAMQRGAGAQRHITVVSQGR